MSTYEQVQQGPRLPFKFYSHDPLTTIDVAPHWHQGIELNLLVAGGPLSFVTDGHTTTHQPGALWAVNRRAVHSASGPHRADWDEFGLIIDEAFLTARLPQSPNWHLTLNGAASRTLAPAAYDAMVGHLTAMRRLIEAGLTPNARLMILSHFYPVLVLLDEAFATPLADADVNPNPSLVDMVMARIDRDYAQPLTTAGIAAQFHVSLTTLNQQFNAAVQMPVAHYVRLVRLMAARRLLLESDKQIDYIADTVGFGSVKSLTRNFKVWKQLTPGAYRRAYARTAKIDHDCL
ncbi:AraC family transcriptional regulator [Lacticaseibacillus daqingensis]|uniref:AraC family transcriptional regulator n=1 Tax=Lacticaseibacillus daqingensis TaxID=2486014 RepID=UPI000F78506C|nr:AraC family transcriptional regulator [Lacticaseibacillus daqingensis]